MSRPLPRPIRIQLPGGIFHVTSRGNRQQPIFRRDDDRHRFLNLFARVAGQVGWRCHAYCLMPNHYHLAVETPEANLSAGMHRLNGGYARWFNRRYNLNGHLFQQRFHAVLVESDGHLLELSRYLAFNPVRAGLCRTPAAWPWSSYRLVAEPLPSPAFFARDKVLGYFGGEPDRARETFKAFVTDLAA